MGVPQCGGGVPRQYNRLIGEAALYTPGYVTRLQKGAPSKQ